MVIHQYQQYEPLHLTSSQWTTTSHLKPVNHYISNILFIRAVTWNNWITKYYNSNFGKCPRRSSENIYLDFMGYSSQIRASYHYIIVNLCRFILSFVHAAISVVFFVFFLFKWEVICSFGGIADHHCVNSLFVMLN
jgi:restriction endonuclease S subunit